MKRFSFFQIVSVMLFIFSFVLGSTALGIDKKEGVSPEEKAWKNVNSFEIQSLKSFLKAFPSGKFTQPAKDALELHEGIQKIRSKKTTVNYMVPFENIGGAKYWAKPGDMGFTGYGLNNNFLYAFWEPFEGGKTPGLNILRTDSNGYPVVSNTDGSIIAFVTNGEDLGYYGGTKFRTPGDVPAYFAVLKGKGLVHLKGEVTVSIKGKDPINLK